MVQNAFCRTSQWGIIISYYFIQNVHSGAGMSLFFSLSLSLLLLVLLFFLLSSFLCFLSFFFLSLHPSSPHIMVWMKFMDEVFVFVTYTLRFDTFVLTSAFLLVWLVKCCWNITIIYRGLKSEVFGKLCAWKCTLVFFRHIYQAFIMESNCLCYL